MKNLFHLSIFVHLLFPVLRLKHFLHEIQIEVNIATEFLWIYLLSRLHFNSSCLTKNQLSRTFGLLLQLSLNFMKFLIWLRTFVWFLLIGAFVSWSCLGIHNMTPVPLGVPWQLPPSFLHSIHCWQLNIVWSATTSKAMTTTTTKSTTKLSAFSFE